MWVGWLGVRLAAATAKEDVDEDGEGEEGEG